MLKRKPAAVAVLVLCQIGVLSVWFSSAAVLGEMASEAGIAPSRLAWMSTAVQLGFGLGAICYAAAGLADRFDPRRVFALSAVLAASANLGLLAVPVGGVEAVWLRGLTGAALAGVYPVGMKIAVGWGKTDRGLLVALLVGALTLGSASPHLIAWGGGADWRLTILVTSALAAAAGGAMLLVGLGPFHARSPGLTLAAAGWAWRDREMRRAILGYLGHMWELYALWAWIGVIAAASFAAAGAPDPQLAKLTAFLAIALGGAVCIPAGWLADRIGKARVAAGALGASGLAALLAAASFGGPVWVTVTVLIIWGIAVIPDSAQFSAMVADAAPPEWAGTLMTVQTALGFLLTAVVVQATPVVAAAAGWPATIVVIALGPAFGLVALRRGRGAT